MDFEVVRVDSKDIVNISVRMDDYRIIDAKLIHIHKVYIDNVLDDLRSGIEQKVFNEVVLLDDNFIVKEKN